MPFPQSSPPLPGSLSANHSSRSRRAFHNDEKVGGVGSLLKQPLVGAQAYAELATIAFDFSSVKFMEGDALTYDSSIALSIEEGVDRSFVAIVAGTDD